MPEFIKLRPESCFHRMKCWIYQQKILFNYINAIYLNMILCDFIFMLTVIEELLYMKNRVS